MNVGFDLVGTLVRKTRDRRPRALRVSPAVPEMVAKLLWHLEQGHNVWVITARPRSARGMEEAARDALRRIGIPDSVPLILQETWNGIEGATMYKANEIRRLGITIYYGDSPHIDGGACDITGCKWVPVLRQHDTGAHGSRNN